MPFKLKLQSVLLLCLFISNTSYAGIVGNDTTISAMNGLPLINGNMDSTVAVTFPDTVYKYEKILMHYSLSQPAAGWDPYDRVAQVFVTKDGEKYEIGRVMTPFSKECGWTLDVTDFRPLLSGTVDLNAFILYYVTAGSQKGYLVSISFQFIGGAPVTEAYKIENLWSNNIVNNRWEYGCYLHPIESYILPKHITIDPLADSVKVNVNLTGHGQFNTDNCAEFCQRTHTLRLDSVTSIYHDLWRFDCADNPCSPQAGTWQYNRAGWCPGADVIPWKVDVTSSAANGDLWLEYIPEAYHNYCSPHDSSCEANVSAYCNPYGSSSCAYTGGHTQPFYLMQSQIIFYRNLNVTGIKNYPDEIKFSVYPNPATETINISGLTSKEHKVVELYNVIGERVLIQVLTAQHTGSRIDVKDVSDGLYLLKIADVNGKNFATQKIVIGNE